MTDTPLTVEELAGLGRGGVAVLRAHFDKMLATIDALTTENATLKAEIEGYRQALEAVEGALRLSKPSLLNQSLSNLVRGALERKNG